MNLLLSSTLYIGMEHTVLIGREEIESQFNSEIGFTWAR